MTWDIALPVIVAALGGSGLYALAERLLNSGKVRAETEATVSSEALKLVRELRTEIDRLRARLDLVEAELISSRREIQRLRSERPSS